MPTQNLIIIPGTENRGFFSQMTQALELLDDRNIIYLCTCACAQLSLHVTSHILLRIAPNFRGSKIS